MMQGMLDAAAEAENYRLPELFAGFGRDEFATPVPYPVACQPQAWAAGAIPYLGRTALGVSADGLNRRLRVRRPSLSHWLDRVEVNGLRVADAEVDLVFERTSGAGVALGRRPHPRRPRGRARGQRPPVGALRSTTIPSHGASAPSKAAPPRARSVPRAPRRRSPRPLPRRPRG